VSDDVSEIWSLYADDGAQALDAAENALLRLKNGAPERAAVAELFRAMHTFKGNARVIGLRVVESRAHLAEDLIGLVRDDGAPLDAELVELLLEVTEVLRVMLDETASRRKDVDEAETADLVLRVTAKFNQCREILKRAKEGPADHAEAIADEPEDMTFTEAVVFEPVDGSTLAEDPEYQKIFADQADELVQAVGQAIARFEESPSAARASWKEQVRWLHLAAGQMGMSTWVEVLGAFLAHDEPTVDHAQALLLRIEALRGKGRAAPIDSESVSETQASVLSMADARPARHGDENAAVAGDSDLANEAGEVSGDVRRLLEVLDESLSELSVWAATLALGQPCDPEAITKIAGVIAAAAEKAGLVRVADIASTLPRSCSSAQAFERSVFLLYESLQWLESSEEGQPAAGFRIQASAVLRSWCAERVFQVLADLTAALDAFAAQDDLATGCRSVAGLLHSVSYACQHHDLAPAANLAISLADLVGRGEHTGEVAASVLHMARSFVTAMQAVFGTAMAGGVPIMSEIDALTRQVSEIQFVVDGTASPVSIEARLGLPASFHKVLTPESVKKALASLDARRRFFIVRADPNADEAMAAAFAEWLTRGAVVEISNVTFFEGDRSVFDYLLATALDEKSLHHALRTLDPTGSRLRIERVLVDSVVASSSPATVEVDPEALAARSAILGPESGDMLEMIGEVVTGEAMLKRALVALSERDVVREVEGIFRGAGAGGRSAQAAVRRHLESWKDEIDRVAALESQLAGGLDRLQEQATASRCRPGSVLLQEMASHAEALARMHARDVTISLDGGDTPVDGRILSNLREPMRALVEFCVTQSIESPERRGAAGRSSGARLTMSLVKHGGSVVIVVEDDGAGLDPARVAARARELGWAEGQGSPATLAILEVVLREGFGAMATEDGSGMSVDFSKIQSELRRCGGELRIGRSHAGGAEFKMTVPLTNVVIDGMVVRVGNVIYVVPVDAIQTIVHSERGEVMRVSADGGQTLLCVGGDDALPVQFLGRNAAPQSANCLPRIRSRPLDSDAAAPQSQGADSRRLFVVAGKGPRRVAISVDEIIGQQLVLMRPLQGYLSLIRGATACALLGGGEVGVVLDVAYAVAQACGDARMN
jgi:two-component system chemotaxis sensor kinase CheA